MPRCPLCGRIGADIVKVLEMIQGHQCRIVRYVHHWRSRQRAL